MICHLSVAQRCRRHRCRSTIHCLTANKSSSGSRRHRRGIVRVGIVPIRAVEVHVVYVADIRVVNIYVANVRSTCAVPIPRMKHFTKTQRKPTDSNTNSEAKSETAAQESYEGRPVNWIVADRPRAPTPASAKIIPASVVVRRKTPRLIANPRPAPRPNVAPISITVRSPANRDAIGIPNWSVVRLLRPRAVIVQVGIAHRVPRHVARRN